MHVRGQVGSSGVARRRLRVRSPSSPNPSMDTSRSDRLHRISTARHIRPGTKSLHSWMPELSFQFSMFTQASNLNSFTVEYVLTAHGLISGAHHGHSGME